METHTREFTPIASRKKINACRRAKARAKFRPSHITCWSACDSVQAVSAIEADKFGARLMLPWNVQRGETIIVSVANEVGLYQTQPVRVAWTERLQLTGKVIAGVEFSEELQIAV